jgi:hypothetical protein
VNPRNSTDSHGFYRFRPPIIEIFIVSGCSFRSVPRGHPDVRTPAPKGGLEAVSAGFRVPASSTPTRRPQFPLLRSALRLAGRRGDATHRRGTDGATQPSAPTRELPVAVALDLVRRIGQGEPLEDAARWAGIGSTTLGRWLAAGSVRRSMSRRPVKVLDRARRGGGRARPVRLHSAPLEIASRPGRQRPTARTGPRVSGDRFLFFRCS